MSYIYLLVTQHFWGFGLDLFCVSGELEVQLKMIWTRSRAGAEVDADMPAERAPYIYSADRSWAVARTTQDNSQLFIQLVMELHD